MQFSATEPPFVYQIIIPACKYTTHKTYPAFLSLLLIKFDRLDYCAEPAKRNFKEIFLQKYRLMLI